MMAANLTGQVRDIAEVVTSVANGDLKRKLVVEAKGEIAALANTINGMIDTLATFAAQVTNVAREVGTAGKLGGQASVPGAAGLWRDLTDNVNQLAANLTTQVRAIAEVATAVTKGDLTRFITVEASGEVAALKDNINEMIRNLKDTTQKNNEQDWLKTNIALLQPPAAGPAQHPPRLEPDPVAARAAGERAPGAVLRHAAARRRERAGAGRELRRAESAPAAAAAAARRRPHRPVRGRQAQSCCWPTRRTSTCASAPASARRGRRTSSSCRRCSKAR